MGAQVLGSHVGYGYEESRPNTGNYKARSAVYEICSVQFRQQIPQTFFIQYIFLWQGFHFSLHSADFASVNGSHSG